jgi:hypothetical protein
MTAANAPTIDDRPIRRPPWIVVVDAALPVVPAFWAVIDLGMSVVGRLARQASPSARVADLRAQLN